MSDGKKSDPLDHTKWPWVGYGYCWNVRSYKDFYVVSLYKGEPFTIIPALMRACREGTFTSENRIACAIIDFDTVDNDEDAIPNLMRDLKRRVGLKA